MGLERESKCQNFESDKPESSEIQNAFEKFILNGWGGASNLMIKTQVFIDIKGCDPSIFVQDYSLPLKVAGNQFILKILK